MKRLLIALALAAAPALAYAGGHARITIEKKPAEVTVAREFQIEFTLAANFRKDAEPTLHAVKGDRVVDAAVTGKKDRYEAKLTLPEAGEWTIAVKSPYCVTELDPTTVTAKAAAPET